MLADFSDKIQSRQIGESLSKIHSLRYKAGVQFILLVVQYLPVFTKQYTTTYIIVGFALSDDEILEIKKYLAEIEPGRLLPSSGNLCNTCFVVITLFYVYVQYTQALTDST